MALAVRRYNTACIARWSRSRAILNATGSCHRVSIAANSSQWTHQHLFFVFFYCQLIEKSRRMTLRRLISIPSSSPSNQGLVLIEVCLDGQLRWLRGHFLLMLYHYNNLLYEFGQPFESAKNVQYSKLEVSFELLTLVAPISRQVVGIVGQTNTLSDPHFHVDHDNAIY
jgi:hypothetical protein